VSWRDAHTADWLANLAAEIATVGNVAQVLQGQDIRIAIDQTTELLFDAGVAHQSLILDEAFRLIDEAKRQVLITYQYFPHTQTADHLEQAHRRGVDLKIYYNHPSQHPWPLNYVYGMTAWSARRRRPASFLHNRLERHSAFMHAKLIASEHSAILGSHNYMQAGVALGTAEIALLSSNPEFAKRAAQTLQQQLSAE